jgi:hypothetical protein
MKHAILAAPVTPGVKPGPRLSMPSIAAPPVTPGPAHFAQYLPMFNPYMFNLMTAYAMGMPGMMGMPTPGMPDQNHIASPLANHSSSPIPTTGDIHAFCVAYGIQEMEENSLEQLSFVLGDNLDGVTEQEYKDVGFKPLAWKWVLKAYKKYKWVAKGRI